MLLQKILGTITTEAIQGKLNREISGIQIDSRQVAKGQAFVAVRGSQNDGHKYIEKAIELGASAIICEEFPTETNPSVTYVKVRNSEHIVGNLATTFYGNPSTKFKLVGVTGTNGKTTIATTQSRTTLDCRELHRRRSHPYRTHDSRPDNPQQTACSDG